MFDSPATRLPLVLTLLPLFLVATTQARAEVDLCQVLLEQAAFGPDTLNDGQPLFGDLDGDGDLEAIFSRYFMGDRITEIYRNNGNESFTILTSIPDFYATAIGDVDGDGQLDLLGADDQFSVFDPDGSLVRGLPGGAFGPIEPIAVYASVVGDFDNDGDLDIASALFSSIQIYLNDSTGFFTLWDEVTVTGTINEVVVADLNDDGVVDLAASTFVSLNGVYKVFLSTDASIDSTEFIEIASGVTGVQVAELDGVPPADCVISRVQGGHVVLFGDGTQGTILDDSSGTTGGLLLDFDADGEIDLVTYGVRIGLHFGLGGGAFGPLISMFEPEPFILAFADLNGDGLNDLATGYSILWNRTLDFEDCDQNGVPDRCDILTADCNGNGVPDSCDLASGAAADDNLDGIPDSCQGFRRGDANADGSINLSDSVFLLAALFSGTATLSCEDAGDFNDDGTVDISDPVGLLAFLFIPSSAPPPPPGTNCGIDATPDSLDCMIGQTCP